MRPPASRCLSSGQPRVHSIGSHLHVYSGSDSVVGLASRGRGDRGGCQRTAASLRPSPCVRRLGSTLRWHASSPSPFICSPFSAGRHADIASNGCSSKMSPQARWFAVLRSSCCAPFAVQKFESRPDRPSTGVVVRRLRGCAWLCERLSIRSVALCALVRRRPPPDRAKKHDRQGC